jgi:AP-4 complex subunit sigma-1
MGIRFVLLVNKQGQTRLAQYYEHLSLDERRALEGEIVRKCLARTDQQVLVLASSSHQQIQHLYEFVPLFFSWIQEP